MIEYAPGVEDENVQAKSTEQPAGTLKCVRRLALVKPVAELTTVVRATDPSETVEARNSNIGRFRCL